MPTKFRSFAELDAGERSYLFGFRRKPLLAPHDDARNPAYYHHHHKEKTGKLAVHLTKRYGWHVDSHAAADELAEVARNTQHELKHFDRRDPAHHKALAKESFRYCRSELDHG